MSKRIFLAVDSDNYFRTCKDHLQWWVDPGKLKDHIGEFGEVVRATYYTSVYDELSEGRDKYHRVLTHMGYEIVPNKVKHIKQIDGTIKDKSSIDIMIAVDACLTVANYDMFVLVSGDGDFTYLLKSLRILGKEFKVISTSGIVARDLREVSGASYIDFEDIKEIVERVDHIEDTNES